MSRECLHPRAIGSEGALLYNQRGGAAVLYPPVRVIFSFVQVVLLSIGGVYSRLVTDRECSLEL